MMTRLVNYREGEVNLVFPINTTRVSIGRESDNMIQLADERISKHHGLIHRAKNTWVIEDLQSRNGVFVNDGRTKHSELKDGDRVKIGPHEFYFETNVPEEDYVPSHIIELSTKIRYQTVREKRSPEQA